MLPEQLLQPRIKVIADMPFKPSQHMYNAGDILTDNGKTAVLDQNGDPVFPCEWEKYPHIFRPLEWWEDRKIEDMPQYIKEVDSLYKIGEVIKVAEWEYCDDDMIWSFRDEKDNCFIWVRGFVPATEAEYNAYINSK